MKKIKDTILSKEFLNTTGAGFIPACPEAPLREEAGFNPAGKEGKPDGAEGDFFMSRKRSKGDFVLVRVLNSCSCCIIHYVEIERQVLQMEIRYLHNAYELSLLWRTQKLCSEGLYVELEPVSQEYYCRFEQVARRHFRRMMTRGKGKSKANREVQKNLS